mgnify:FL=1
MPAPRPRPISDFLPRFQNVAQTSQFIVKFALPYSRSSGLRSFLRRKGVNDRFVTEDAGLLCSDAVLPGSAMASLDTRGDYQGVIERMAHTRNFTQITLEFYVDNEYKSMKFLEHWMEYITGSIRNPADDAYFYQLHYPVEYKSNDTRIVKFERDYNRFLEYRFIGLFPLALNSTRVSYNNSQVLKASASFSFDRYICGESTSLARDLKRAFNEIFNRGNVERDGSSINTNALNGSVYQVFSQGDRSKVENTASGRVGQVTTLNNTNLGVGQVVSNGRR